MKASHLALAFWGLLIAVVGVLFVVRMQQRGDVEPAASAAAPETITADAALVGREVGPFQLTERSGESFSSEALDGELWVASFFFTSCPGACLTMNHAIARLQQDWPAAPLRFISITVHPEYDTPERLKEYAERFDADPDRWLFLTGEMDAIRNVAEGTFMVSAEPGTHSDRLFLVDRDGRILGAYRGTDDLQVDRLKKKVSELVGEAS